MTKRDIETAIEELADSITADADAAAASTKAEAGISADFIRFAGDPLPEIPDGWEWEHREHGGEHGPAFMVAVREDTEQ